MIEARESESESDGDLLSRYQQLDDVAAYTELDRRYRAGLVKQARRNLHRTLREDAEDVVHNALLKFHENRKTYAPQDVHALLQTLVCSACKDHARRTRAAKRDCRKTFPLEDGQFAAGLDGNRAGNHSDPKADPCKQETKMDVDAAVAALTPEQAQAVRLDMAGHSHESAAEVTGISPEGQRRRLYSARRRIKDFLAPSIILLALIGILADNCDADVSLGLCTAEEDVDDLPHPALSRSRSSSHARRHAALRTPSAAKRLEQ